MKAMFYIIDISELRLFQTFTVVLYCVPHTWLYLSPVLFLIIQFQCSLRTMLPCFVFLGWFVIGVVYTTIIIILRVCCLACVYFCVFCLLSVCVVPCKYTLHLKLKGYWDWPQQKLEPRDACWHCCSPILSLVKKKITITWMTTLKGQPSSSPTGSPSLSFPLSRAHKNLLFVRRWKGQKPPLKNTTGWASEWKSDRLRWGERYGASTCVWACGWASSCLSMRGAWHRGKGGGGAGFGWQEEWKKKRLRNGWWSRVRKGYVEWRWRKQIADKRCSLVFQWRA